MSAFVGWLSAFVFTQVVEVPIYRRALGGRTLVAFGASAITHPFVWFVFPRLHVAPWICLTAAESFAVLVEASWIWLFGVRGVPRCLGWSLVANGASLSLGMVCRALFGWP
jgi:hypothetical protein